MWLHVMANQKLPINNFEYFMKNDYSTNYKSHLVIYFSASYNWYYYKYNKLTKIIHNFQWQKVLIHTIIILSH